jgi:DNA-directed RNA polymerase subunit K/omega
MKNKNSGIKKTNAKSKKVASFNDNDSASASSSDSGSQYSEDNISGSNTESSGSDGSDSNVMSSDDSFQTGGDTDGSDITNFEDSNGDGHTIENDIDDDRTDDNDGFDEYDPINDSYVDDNESSYASSKKDNADADADADADTDVNGDADEDEDEDDVTVQSELESEIDSDSKIAGKKDCKKKRKKLSDIVDDDTGDYITTEYVENIGDDRESNRILTYYEQTRLLGIRTQQLYSGAKSVLNNVDKLSYEKIAHLELLTKTIPLKIRRFLPGRVVEKFCIDELKIIHKFGEKKYSLDDINWKELSKKLSSDVVDDLRQLGYNI